jgi:hypothetical protein
MNFRTFFRDLLLASLILPCAAAAANSQQTIPPPSGMTPAPFALEPATPSGMNWFKPIGGNSGHLNGNHDFDRFIGFLSNPLQSIDPRAVTEIWPLFGSSWAYGNAAHLPDANMQVYGAGLNLALSDRLAVGLNQGGYAALHVSRDRQGLLASMGLPVPDRQVGGTRDGWLNLGGFVQYTLIANVERQFILTAGVRWEAPAGATQMFQGGANPAYLAPYITMGKEFGCWHVLATGGYEFPAGSGQATTDTAYLNLHIDRQIGRLYPLVEFNGSYHNSTVDLGLPARHGLVDLGTFSSSGNMVATAVGANAVLIPGKLEFGAVYTRQVMAQDRFQFNGVLVKMVYRY